MAFLIDIKKLEFFNNKIANIVMIVKLYCVNYGKAGNVVKKVYKHCI